MEVKVWKGKKKKLAGVKKRNSRKTLLKMPFFKVLRWQDAKKSQTKSFCLGKKQNERKKGEKNCG